MPFPYLHNAPRTRGGASRTDCNAWCSANASTGNCEHASNTRRAASRITHSRFCLIFEPEAFAEAWQHARGKPPQRERTAGHEAHPTGLVNHESGRRTLPARRKSVAWRTVLWTCSLLICIWRAFAHRASCTHHFWNMATTWRAKGSRIAP